MLHMTTSDVVRTNCFPGSGISKVGLVVSDVFRMSNASCCVGVHSQALSFFSSSVNGALFREKSCTNLTIEIHESKELLYFVDTPRGLTLARCETPHRAAHTRSVHGPTTTSTAHLRSHQASTALALRPTVAGLHVVHVDVIDKCQGLVSWF